jgi:long-chain acyl-CoA synthetase
MNYKILNKFKNNTAFISEKNEKKTYANFIKDIKEINKIKIAKKSLVLLQASQTYSFCCFFYNFINSNIIPIILNEKIDIIKSTVLIKKYQPNYIFSLIELNISVYKLKFKYDNYYIYIKIEQTNHKISKDISLLMSTSGSTGSAKLVALSLENLLSNTKSICKYLNISSRDITITTLPLSYSYGLSIINTHLFKGGKIILNNKSFFEKQFWEFFKDYKINYIYGVPFSYEILFKLGIFKKNIKSIKYFAVAGGAMEKNLLQKYIDYCKKSKKRFICMYGQTEATTRIAYLPFEKLQKKIGSIGLPIPGGNLKILNQEGKEITKILIEGEISYKGNNVMVGYIENKNDLTKYRSNDYSLKTGDLGYFDKDNFFYITGRKKRIVKIYGHRISLDQLQSFLLSKDITNACICKNDLLYIFVNNDKFKNERIIELINLFIDINISKFIRFIKIKSLPISTSGKIQYYKLYEHI